MHNANFCARRPGLTLIELTVVLLILVALAGILVPQLTGYLERSHTASTANNIGEIVKHWETFKVKYTFNLPVGQVTGGYPNRLDSLIVTPGTAATLYSQLEADLAGLLTPTALAAPQTQSLADAGVTHVYDHQAAAAFPTSPPFVPSATFDGPTTAETHYATSRTAPRPLADTEFVAMVNPGAAPLGAAALAAELNVDPAGVYAVFGVGTRCTAVGTVMADAPLHFSESSDPNDVYQRFLVVFQIPAAGAPAFKARFVGVLGAEGGGIGAHLSEYFQAQ